MIFFCLSYKLQAKCQQREETVGRCVSVKHHERKTSYQLQTTQEDQHASCRAAAHLPSLSALMVMMRMKMWIIFKIYIFLKHKHQTCEASGPWSPDVWGNTHTVHFTSGGKHVGCPCVGTSGGGGELYEGLLVPQWAAEEEEEGEILLKNESPGAILALVRFPSKCSANVYWTYR